jgi:hypothetical protein
MLSRALCSTAALAGILTTFGCKSPTANRTTAPSASASAAPSASALVPDPRTAFQIPVGPRLAILAGQGIGAIRIGATVPTIERLMEAPCEIKTPDKCRYIMQAVEFELKDGVTDRIVIHRHERPAGPDAQGKPQTYGFFNGGIPPYLGFGMIPSAIIKVLGPPTSVEKVTTPNDFHTVERDTYPGMVLEYDTYTNGNVILGGAIITKANVSPPVTGSSTPPSGAATPKKK